MNRTTCVAMTLLVFAVLCVSPAISSDGLKLQYDGLYKSIRTTSDIKLRFYPDGTVISINSKNQPEKIWKWISKNSSGVTIGKVMIEGNNLSFSTAWGRGRRIDYSGKIDDDQLHLSWYNHTNQLRGTDSFVFVKISDKPVMKVVENPKEITLESELFSLAVSGTPDEIASILDKGANIESKNPQGETALILSAKNGKIANVKFFLEKGADANAASDLKLTALMTAAIRDYSDVVDILLASGADVNKRASNGFTAVMMAAAQGSLCCLSLIENGADVDIKGNDGKITALELAKINLEKYGDPQQYVTRNRYSLIIKWIEQASRAKK